MFRNNISPLTLFILFIACVALLALGVGGEIYLEKLDHRLTYESGWNTDDLLAIITFIGVGSLLLVGALGLWLHKNWARYLVQTAFMLAGASWLIFLGFLFQTPYLNDMPWIFLTGSTACILGLVLGSILFLNNRQWVLPYFVNRNDAAQSHKVLDRDW